MKASRLLIPGVCASLLLLTACFQGEQSSVEIDPPENAEAVNDTANNDQTEVEDVEAAEENTEEAADMIARQLYLIDENGMVASQIIELPLLDSNEVATQVLEYLVDDGPVMDLLPNGFRAVLPAGTEVLGLNLLEDGTMVVDFSKEFEEYAAEDEVKILEAITHTLTQFDSVERVQLWVNGHPLDEMPVNGTPIGKGYSQAHGINVMQNDTIDFINSEAVTMYYPASDQENRYYIPVTQYVGAENEEEMFEAIVTSLMEGPGFMANVTHVFNDEAMLVSEPVLSEGVLELTFNEAILKDVEEAVIADEVMETIVRTLTVQDEIDAVDIKVENKDVIANENGEPYSDPVTADFFVPSEKL